MLSQKISNIVKISRKQIFQSSSVFKLSTNPSNDEKGFEKNIQQERKLKEWTDPHVAKESFIPLQTDNPFFKFFQVQIEASPSGIKKFVSARYTNIVKKLQSFDPVRNKILGPDVSLAYFIIHNRGRVKFKGHDNWLSLRDKNIKLLPKTFDVTWILEEIDISDSLIYVEGLENFRNSTRVKRIISRRSPNFDDWFVDIISGSFPLLEYLDISENPQLTERCLEALYKNRNLKTIVITNYSQTAAFELTCMMLEDVVPGLKIEILEPKYEDKLRENK